MPKKTGGARPGAGRPTEEPAKNIRVPMALEKDVRNYIARYKQLKQHLAKQTFNEYLVEKHIIN